MAVLFPLESAPGLAGVAHAMSTASFLHLTGTALELTVLCSLGAALMLCSMLVRKAAGLVRQTPHSARALSKTKQFPLPETAE